MRTPVPFVLCADDYGLSPAVSAGIRNLLAAKRLSATSCLVTGPYWTAEGAALRDLAPDADIGLHLALTDLSPLGTMPSLTKGGRLPTLGRLMTLAYLRKLDSNEIGDEIDRQLDAFEKVMGRPPDHVDGHHHVHQLPVVRDLLVKRLGRRLPLTTAIRLCDEPLGAIVRHRVAASRAFVIACNARPLRKILEKTRIRRNKRFSGIRHFKEQRPYRDLFRQFIRREPNRVPKGLLIACHPGYVDEPLYALDEVVETRTSELAFFQSDEFIADLQAAGLRLGRFNEISQGSDEPVRP